MSNQKIAVVGSRTMDVEKVVTELFELDLYAGDEIVSGGAKGADTGAREFVIEHNSDGECELGWPPEIKLVEFLPEWDKHGKGAGFIRNAVIADYADRCIAFWDGKSNGTRDTINKFLDKGKPVQVHVWEMNDE